MILRKLKWILLCELLCSIIVESQNERSYDTSEWIPITPTPNSDSSEAANAATGRVLNVDTPNQKFFPENQQNHHKRNPNVQQYLRENTYKANERQKQKNVDKYRFEVPPQAPPRGQYFPTQEIKLATYERPPPLTLEQPIATRQQVPPPNAPNLYQQYNLPFNSSFYQSLNPSSINQELQNGFQAQPVPTTSNSDEKQSVQLVYVPLENLKPSTQLTQDTENIFQQVDAPREENHIYNQNRQHLIDDIEHDLIQQTVQAHRLQQQIHLGRPVAVHATTTTTTTPKPTKRKPHQPPLAVYLESSNPAGVDDVLEVLRDAKTIAVQDAVLPNSPQVFVGPSNINIPSGYSRFALPYINKLDGNRNEKKIENLPFFVAPLSYKTPPGYSKIPLPSPHVGSVVVSVKEDSHKRSAPKPTPSYSNQIKEYEAPKPTITNVNTQYDPLHNTYYSTTPFFNPSSDGQKPYYLQFNVNDNVKQFPGPSTAPQSQLQQPQGVVSNPPQVAQVPVSSYQNQGPTVSYNQGSTNTQTVPNPYSTPVRSTVENPNKYSFNQEQNIPSYQAPTRQSSSVGTTSNEGINSYQIPTRTAQYTQQVDEKKEQYTVPQTIENLQKARHPATTEGQYSGGAIPATRPSTAYYNEPSSSFLSSPFGNSHEVNITPKTTTTSKPSTEETQKYSFGSGEGKQNPLDLAINQFELHQINSQLVDDNTEKNTKDPFDYSSHFQYDKPSKEFDYSAKYEVENSKSKGKYDYSSIFDPSADKPKFDYSAEYERYSSTPATILRDTYEEVTTTPRAPVKSRRRGKPTRQPARTTTTAHPHEKETYTVLEEFSAKPVSTPTEPTKEVKYQPEYNTPTQLEGGEAPASVYRIRTTTTPKYEPSTPQYDNIKTVIEDIPANVYSLNVNQNAPVYQTPTSQQEVDQIQKEKQTNLGGNEAVSHPPSFVQSPLTEISYVPKYNENPIEPLVQNRGQKPQDNPYNFERQPDHPDYTSSLQDQQVRTHLVPNLVVPTTEQYQPQYEPVEQYTTTPATTTSTTTTTEQPRTTHTTRARGRQRGGSRFSTASATTQASVPRRNVNRRRPVHPSRTTTENPSSQYASREDVQKVNTRQRFRTRTRPSQQAATERISSTENEVRSYTSEASAETQPETTGPQSYIQFENKVEDQKVIVQSEDTPITDYPQYYSPQLPVTVTENPRLLLQYENTATTQHPFMDIQITHPAPKVKKQPVARLSEEAHLHLQAGGVLHNNVNHNHNSNNEVSPPRQNRVRGRGRARTRVATTTEKPVARTTARPVIRVAPKRTTTIPTTTTTQKTTSKSAAEDEFFGFIRQPNFNQIYNIQVPAATQQPIQIYQNPNQPANSDVRVSSYQVFGNANKNPNVRVQSYQIPQGGVQQSEDVRLNFNGEPSDGTTVHFLGEIRPKYTQPTQNYEEITATEPTEAVRTETPRTRIRGRARIPQRKNNPRPQDNEISTYRTQQATRRSNVGRTRGRGNVQYRVPENIRPKEDRDADVEGGNYPPSFFQNRQAATNAPTFQISIGPNGEDDEGDQLTNPSLYQPKIVPRPEEWTEATGNNDDEEYSPANQIDDDIHLEGETISPEETTEEEPIALPVTSSEEATTTDSSEAFLQDAKAMEEMFEEVNKTEKPKPKGRRRGVWKLIKQRPVEAVEGAESQNYYSVVNAFGDIVKVKDKKGYGDSKDDWKLGQHQLYNNYNPVLEQNSEAFEYESKKLPTTEDPNREATKYYEVHDLNAETENVLVEISSTIQPETSFNSTEPSGKSDSIFDTIYEMFGYVSKSNESTTTTATTTTETETTTVVSPTFPEEITEVPTTLPPLESTSELPSVTSEDIAKIETTTPKTQITRTYDVEPWEMRAVRTSTSTEISHETEICYRGRCVKSTDRTTL